MRKIAWAYRTRRWAAKRLTLAVMLTATVCGTGSAFAQAFDSGSTGADGAFNPTCTPTPCTVTVPLPETGVFNFTTINIPTGVTVKFTRNATNTPVTMFASGNVTIAGTVDLNGGAGASGTSGTTIGPNGGVGGPGGFDGGDGGDGIITTGGGAGLGPGGGGGGISGNSSGAGGGFALAGSSGTGGVPAGGAAYGTPSLLPLIGGSGGGGGAVTSFGMTGGGGGGGGGAVLIASSGTLTFTGTLAAQGGTSGYSPYGAHGGGGSGGAVRLVATTITGSGGSISVSGGYGYLLSGSVGRIRIEAFTSTATINLTQTSSIAQPGVLALPNGLGLAITSVAGVATPTSPTGSFATPDITLPADTANPMTITLAASNIPLGTTVTVTVKPIDGSATTATSTPLGGTLEASTATASLTIATNQPSVISASATFTVAALPGATPVYADGEKVERVRVAAILGGRSQVAYITASGRELPTGTRLDRPLIGDGVRR